MTIPKSFNEQKRIKLTFKNQDVIDVDRDGHHSCSLSIINDVIKFRIHSLYRVITKNPLSISIYHLELSTSS